MCVFSPDMAHYQFNVTVGPHVIKYLNVLTAPLSRRSQARTKVPLACSVRSSRGLFKSEPGEDHADGM